MYTKVDQNTTRIKFIYAIILICTAYLTSCVNNATDRKIVNTSTPREHRRQWWLSEWEQITQPNQGNLSIRVAVVDDGVKKNIPELKGKICKHLKIDNIAGEGGTHSTGVASIIAAESSSTKQVQGITHSTEIVSIDITDEKEGIIKNNALLEGLQLAISEHPDIINLSLGTQQYNKKVHALIKTATEKGIIVVASAGNFMESDLLYPAKLDGVIAVGAIDKDSEILSPKGTLSKPVIYLPGKNIVTAIGNNKYIGAYGSSFSTAIATGMIASSLENACLSKEEIRQMLNSTQTNVVGINDFATLLNMRNQ